MRIKRLELENFCCFEGLGVDLDPNFNLIVGKNGSGKTSFLRATSVALGNWLWGIGVESRGILDEERRRVKADERKMIIAGNSIVKSYFLYNYNKNISEGIEISCVLNKHSSSVLGSEMSASSNTFNIRRISEKFVCLFYSVNRLNFLNKIFNEKYKNMNYSNAYLNCFEGVPDIYNLNQWMYWRQEIQLTRMLEMIRRGKQPLFDDFKDTLFEAVSLAAGGCIEEGARLNYSLEDQELWLEFKDGRETPFRMLSDGYRGMVTLAADIAWRAAQLNPHYGADAAERARGVVLIDEIDLCLHPTWQHRVCQDLRRVFPNIQFIATTHSPQVISTARPEWIRIVSPDGTVEWVTHSFGKDSNAVLREIMGATERPPQAILALDELERQIGDGDLEQARATLERLRRDLGADRRLLGLEWELRDQETARAEDGGAAAEKDAP